MLTDPANLVTLHRRWGLGSLLALVGAGVWYWFAATRGERWPGGSSLIGLVLGGIGALIILFECALGLRKTRWFRTQRWLGTAQFWMKAHIWLGLLVFPLAWMHAGFTFGGLFTSLLMGVLLVVVLSGIFGLALQNYLPRWMLENLSDETVYSQIEVVQAQYAEEAARLVWLRCGRVPPEDAAVTATAETAASAGGVRRVGAERRLKQDIDQGLTRGSETQPLLNPAVVLDAYEQCIRPYLAAGSARHHWLASQRRGREYFDSLRTSAGEESHSTITALQRLCDRVRDLQQQRRVHVLLHSWLAIHLPLSLALLLLLVLHIAYALRFG